MERVGLNPEHYNRYPNEFSGGQRQRIGIARARRAAAEAHRLRRACLGARRLDPGADPEPPPGPPGGIRRSPTCSSPTISRSCGRSRTASRSCTSARSWRCAPRKVIYSTPLHPYTHSLLSAVPVPDPGRQRKRARILLEGDLPSPIDPPSGCVFRTRCFQAQEVCSVEVPPLMELAPGHHVACHFPIEASQIRQRPLDSGGGCPRERGSARNG